MSKLLAFLVLILMPLVAVSGQEKQQDKVNGTGDDSDRLVPPSSRNVPSPLAESEKWFLKTIDDILRPGGKRADGAEPKKSLFPGKEAFEKLFQDLVPKFSTMGKPAKPSSGQSSTVSKAPATSSTTTSTTSTTTPAPTTIDPMRQIERSLQNIGTALSSSSVKLLETPLKVFESLLTTGANLTQRVGALGQNRIDQAAEGLVSTSSKLTAPRPPAATVHHSNHHAKKPDRRDNHDEQSIEDDLQYYEFAGPHEPYAFRRPKYFSLECPFRFACEVGKLMKPFTFPVSKQLETNRFIQDLQNRYTRAMTYGTLRGDCERYYCVLVKMLGGPAGFAGGVAEMVNRVVNSDLYTDYETQRRLRRSPRRLPSHRRPTEGDLDY